MPFYPADWLKEPSLRICTHEVKGVYIDILCLMWECEERGVLATAGTAWSDEEIARAVGGDQQRTLKCVVELVDRRVVSRRASGAVYSRRMVRDEATRAQNAEESRGRMRKKRGRDVTVGVTPSVTENVTGSVTDTPVSVIEVDSVSKLKERKRFIAPSVEEVRSYCAERGNKVDAEAFVSYYEARGWKVKGGGNLHKWQSAIVTWEKNDYSTKQPVGREQERIDRNVDVIKRFVLDAEGVRPSHSQPCLIEADVRHDGPPDESLVRRAG